MHSNKTTTTSPIPSTKQIVISPIYAFRYTKEMLTTLLPRRMILPSLRLVSSLVSSTSSSTRFMYSSYPKSLPSMCRPSFNKRSNFWFTAFSRTSNGRDMPQGKDDGFLKLFPWLLEEKGKVTGAGSLQYEDSGPRATPSLESPLHQSRSHSHPAHSSSPDRSGGTK